MTKMEYPAGAPAYSAHFYYGPDGFLVKQKVSGTWTRFVNNGGLVLQDRDNNDAVLRTYMWDGVSPGGIGGLLEMNLLAQHYNYLYDGKGNVASVLNNLQAEVAKYRYDSFGSLVAQSGTLNQAYRFSTKRYYQGYGVSYFGYRFHVAHLGRWMTEDPAGEGADVNLYRAMYNNYINRIDPYGDFVLVDDAALLAILGLTIATVAVVEYVAYLQTPDGQAMLAENTKHVKKVIDGLLEHAKTHANKCSSGPPNDPNQKKWREEIKVALDKIRKLATKRLPGKAKDEALKTADEIENAVKK